MTDSNNKNNPEWLYRRYQESRDNISPSVYNALRKKLEDEQHESSIYAITQLAKTAAYANEAVAPKKAKSSWFARTIAKIGTASPQLGMVAACLAIVAVIAPFGFNSTSSSLSSATHLSDCAECINYAANASVTTRGVATPNLGLGYRQAARLGALSGKLHVLTAYDPDQALKIALADLNKLPTTIISDGLTALKSESDPSLNKLDQELRNASPNPSVFEASKALFIANVTTRHALASGSSDGLSASIEAAVKAFNGIEDRSSEQNRQIETLEGYKAKPADKKLLRAIEFMSKSLGG